MSDWGTAVTAWESTNDDDSVDVLFARSNDYGATWNAPTPLNNPSAAANGHAPSIATDGAGNWIVAWAEWTEFQFAVRYSITIATSSDDGLTWTTPGTVGAVTLPKPDALWSSVTPNVSTDRAGHWIIAWDGLDPTAQPPNDSDIVAVRSSNLGVTWDTPTLIHPSGNFLFDTTPRLLSSGNGKWIAIWSRASNATANAAFVTATSNDGGVTWSSPATIPSIGGDYAFLTDAATDRKGTVVITTYQIGLFGAATKVQSVRSTDNGATWETPDRLNPDAKINTDELRPAIATDRNGNWLALWWDNSGAVSDIRCSHSNNNGDTWSLPVSLDDTASTERPVLGRPCVAAGVTGRWVTAWPTTKAISKSGTYELASLSSSTSAFTEHDDLYLIAPNKSANVPSESTLLIQWISTGSPGATVRVELFRDAALSMVITPSTENDGAYRWKIPKKVRGNGYKIRVVSVENPACSDRSDKRFGISRASSPR